MEAEADVEITRVTLFYQLLGRTSPVYGYPSFDPGRRITAEFRLSTGGARYIPSGVNIGYHYVIGDAAGDTVQSQRYVVPYRDPALDWNELRVGDLSVLYHDISERRVREVAEDVNLRLGEVKELLGLETSPVMRAVILGSHREADRSFPLVSQAAKRGHLYAGFAFSDFGLFALVGLDRDGMVHEMTHLLLAEAVDNPLSRVPAWLNEGLAMHFEKDSFRRQREVADAARRDAFFSLRSMSNVPGRPEEVRLFYAQSWSVVEFMFKVYGAERMMELLRAIDGGIRIEQAIPEVYGIGVEQLERAWSADVVATTPLARRPDLRTIGSSLIIAAAIAVAAVLAFTRWASRRNTASQPQDIDG